MHQTRWPCPLISMPQCTMVYSLLQCIVLKIESWTSPPSTCQVRNIDWLESSIVRQTLLRCVIARTCSPLSCQLCLFRVSVASLATGVFGVLACDNTPARPARRHRPRRKGHCERCSRARRKAFRQALCQPQSGEAIRRLPIAMTWRRPSELVSETVYEVWARSYFSPWDMCSLGDPVRMGVDVCFSIICHAQVASQRWRRPSTSWQACR